MAPFARGKAGYQWIRLQLSPGTKQISTGTTDVKLARRIDRMCKELADDKRWELLRAVASGRLSIDTLWAAYQVRGLERIEAELKAVQLADYLDGWRADAQRKAPAAWKEQERHVQLLLDALTYAHECKPGRLRDLLNAQSGGEGTRRHKLYAWSSFCRYLVAHDVLDANPCADKEKIPRPGKAKKRTVWRDEAVDRAIVDRTSGDVRIALVLCAASGADRATPLAMKVRDVKLLAPGVVPDATALREHRVDLPGSKTEGRDRKGIRLEPWAAPILRDWIKGKLPDAPLVTGVSTDMLTRHWQVAAAAERQQGYWLRDTRHSYGVRAFLAGYPLWEISKWLGHASVAMTAEIYLQFDYDVAQAVRRGQLEAPGTGQQAAK